MTAPKPHNYILINNLSGFGGGGAKGARAVKKSDRPWSGFARKCSGFLRTWDTIEA